MRFGALTTFAFALALLTAITASAGAQPKKRPPTSLSPPTEQAPLWAEPTSFLGLEFGKPLADQTSVIIECPRNSSYSDRDWNYKGFCYEVPTFGGHKFRPAHNGPDIGVGYSMTLIVSDDIFQGAIVTIHRLNKDPFLALL